MAGGMSFCFVCFFSGCCTLDQSTSRSEAGGSSSIAFLAGSLAWTVPNRTCGIVAEAEEPVIGGGKSSALRAPGRNGGSPPCATLNSVVQLRRGRGRPPRMTAGSETCSLGGSSGRVVSADVVSADDEVSEESPTSADDSSSSVGDLNWDLPLGDWVVGFCEGAICAWLPGGVGGNGGSLKLLGVVAEAGEPSGKDANRRPSADDSSGSVGNLKWDLPLGDLVVVTWPPDGGWFLRGGTEATRA
jgi:hypothetical protein